MNKTKRNILDAALTLLNNDGIAIVSQRSIADRLNISPGNLTYHYKKKADIIEAIYFELVDHMNEVFEISQEENTNFETLTKITEGLFDVLLQYRFFFIDIVQIIRNYPIIATSYRKIQETRKKQFKGMIAQLLEQGIIRSEELPNEYEELYTRIQINFDFYLSFVGVNNIQLKQNYIEEQKQTFLYTIYPYLTLEGKEKLSFLN